MLRIAIFATFFVLNMAYHLERCPPGRPMAMCSGPPCANVAQTICEETFCGGCKATCYVIRNIVPEVIPCTFLRGPIFANKFGQRGRK